MIIAASVFVGGWVVAVIANRVSGPDLRLSFGVFVVALGVSLMVGASAGAFLGTEDQFGDFSLNSELLGKSTQPHPRGWSIAPPSH